MATKRIEVVVPREASQEEKLARGLAPHDTLRIEKPEPAEWQEGVGLSFRGRIFPKPTDLFSAFPGSYISKR